VIDRGGSATSALKKMSQGSMDEVPTESIAAVVFDLDGLMVNTEEVFHTACSRALLDLGFELRPEVHRQMIGRRTREAFTILVEHLGVENFDMDEPVDRLIDVSHSAFDVLLETELRTMPGLFELLEQIRLKQIPRAVATSSSRPYLERVLQRIELHSEFRVMLTGDDVEHAKPSPEIYLKTARALNVPPQQMLVFEDSEAGTQAAASAGARVISIPHQHTRHQDFSNAFAVAERLDCPLIMELLATA